MELQVRQRSGYVLVMTLLLLMMAAVALAAAARGSLGRALGAVDDAERLQRRWGTITLAAALEGRIESLLAEAGTQAAAKEQPPPASLRVELALGEQAFEVVLSDEQAKVNLNDHYARHGPAAAGQVVRQLLRESDGGVVRVRPEAFAQRHGIPVEEEVRWQSWDELFDGASPEQLLSGATAELTLWGDGRLNLHRASTTALEAVVRPVLGFGDAQELLRLRKEQPTIKLEEAMNALELSDEKRQDLAAVLSDLRSSCHSIAIGARGRHRWWRRLVILQSIGRVTPQRQEFVW